MPLGHLYVFFGEMSIRVFCPFFNQAVWGFLILSCMSYLYIFVINPLSVATFENIFSHSIGFLFILLIVSVAGAKHFKFNWVQFVSFCFHFQYSGGWVIEDPAVI